MTDVNVPLLRKYVEWVEEQDARTEGREWYQPQFAAQGERVGEHLPRMEAHFCDTAYCVAGKIVVDHGWTPVFDDYWLTSVCERDGQTAGIDDVAQELLGISGIDASVLFAGGNDAADIRRIAEDIAGERL